MSRVLRYASEVDLPAHLRPRAAEPSRPKNTDACQPRGDREHRSHVDSGAHGVAKVNVRMNRTESAYAEHLELRRRAGEVGWFAFEAMKLRLADKTFYTPDFAVMLSDGTIEQHEVKGFWEDDARVKIKVAAALFPFRFIGVQKQKSGWKFEEFTREGARQ